MAEKTASENVADATTVTVSDLVIGKDYNINVTGFTYIKDWAMIRGKLVETGEPVGVIIGDKMSFGMRDMFTMRKAGGVIATYSKDKIVNGQTYKQFSLREILY
jgi:hypothetical protein